MLPYVIWRGEKMTDEGKVWLGKGVKIRFPLRYDDIASDLKGCGAALETTEDYWIAEVPTSIAIPFNSNIGREGFRKFYSEAKVEGGRKRWLEDEELGIPTIEVIPNRKKIVSIRVSEAEYAIIEHVAKNLYCEDVTAWIRKTLVKEALGEIMKRTPRLMPYR